MKKKCRSEDNSSEIKLKQKIKDLLGLIADSRFAWQEKSLNRLIDLRSSCRKLYLFSPLAHNVLVNCLFFGKSTFQTAVEMQLSEIFVKKIYRSSVEKIWRNLVDYHQEVRV